jgi:hypothetical protein
MEQVNPWTQVVSLLSHLASGADSAGAQSCRAGGGSRQAARNGKRSESHQALSAGGHRSKITAIERLDEVSALVSWCDPTMCHYVDQVWTRVIARGCGYCALTGERIQKGDAIFRPRGRGQHRPVNCNEMILVAAFARGEWRI